MTSQFSQFAKLYRADALLEKKELAKVKKLPKDRYNAIAKLSKVAIEQGSNCLK